MFQLCIWTVKQTPLLSIPFELRIFVNAKMYPVFQNRDQIVCEEPKRARVDLIEIGGKNENKTVASPDSV